MNEKKLPSNVNVRHLYQPGELEGGTKRAADPIWSLKVYTLERAATKPDDPILYYLVGPKRGFSARSSWLSRQIHSCRLLMLGKKSRHPSSSVALPTSQPHIPLAVGLAIVKLQWALLLLNCCAVGALSAYHRIAARLTGAAAWPV